MGPFPDSRHQHRPESKLALCTGRTLLDFAHSVSNVIFQISIFKPALLDRRSGGVC